MSTAPRPAAEVPWDLLARHLAGEATPGEREALRAWVAAEPERLGLLTDATRAWERAGAAPVPTLFSAADVDAAWLRFKPLMQAALSQPAGPLRPQESASATMADDGPSNVLPMRSAAKFSMRPLLRVAAAVLLLVGAVFAFRSFRAQLLPATPRTVATGAQKRLLTLPDGSQVWLNRNSSLVYAPDFSAVGREVMLVGEAFFAVKKDHSRPFTVRTAASRTRVLGTSFNVRAYPTEDSVEVAVVTGRVALALTAAPPDSVLLTPGTRGVVYTGGARQASAVPALRHGRALDANFRAWQTDELVFDNAPLSHVVRTLRTTFGTSITVADAGLLNCRFTGTFRRPAPQQVLAVLSVATNATLRGDASAGFVLSGAGCP